jgi:hypothetical protein
MEMRREGLPFHEIARRLGWADASSAQKAVRHVLQETMQPVAAEVRAEELSKLDFYESKIAKQVAKGSLKAIALALKIQERRARLLGLDAPVQIDAPPGASVSFVVALPPKAASVDAWQQQTLDVIPESVEAADDAE